MKTKILEIIGLLLVVITLLFGDNFFLQITGENLFEALNIKEQYKIVIIGGSIAISILIIIGICCQLRKITLNTKNRIISASCINDEIIHISNFLFVGENKSKRRPINNISGYLQSNITNRTYPIYFNVEGSFVPPENTNGYRPKEVLKLLFLLQRMKTVM